MAITMDRLSEISAVSGAEDAIREYLIPQILKVCDDLKVDSIGNIIAYKKGCDSSRKILIGTHIDEVGFIVSDITETGFVKFKSIGQIDPRTLVSKTVKIGDGVAGVIGMKAIHLQKREERETAVKIKDLYIDIGATSKKSAQKKVNLGDRITFLTEFKDEGNVIKGKALDRMGCIAVLDAMNIKPKYDTYYVFASQREVEAAVMGRGMRVATHRIDPDYALIISSVNSDDFMDAKLPSARLGDGAVVEYMDRTALANVKFTDAIEKMALSHGIKCRRKTSHYGASQAGAVETSATGCATAVVSIPCRYSHTPVGLINKNDIVAVCDIVRTFIKESDVIINGITEKVN